MHKQGKTHDNNHNHEQHSNNENQQQTTHTNASSLSPSPSELSTNNIHPSAPQNTSTTSLANTDTTCHHFTTVFDSPEHASKYVKDRRNSSSYIRPLVLCGPSGVGKGTLLKRLLSDYPDVFGKSVSHTTRQPRSGEVDGVSYHFVTRDEFQRDIDQGGIFIEYAVNHGNMYGQSVQAVSEVSSKGIICILEIDVQGAVSVSKTDLHPYYLFILPPSTDELRSRLIHRGSENDDSMKRRLETAENELEFHRSHSDMWHATIVNEHIDQCYHEMLDTLAKFYPHFQAIRKTEKQKEQQESSYNHQSASNGTIN